jgi:predicted nucleic acid-binding protein
MLVVDASVLYEVITNGRHAGAARAVLASDGDQAAPQLLDAEVVGLIRRDLLHEALDGTASQLAVTALIQWPGERFSLHPFVDRVWELRDNVRSWDAFYVALAEALACPLVTLDRRLASATGPRCEIQVVG